MNVIGYFDQVMVGGGTPSASQVICTGLFTTTTYFWLPSNLGGAETIIINYSLLCPNLHEECKTVWGYQKACEVEKVLEYKAPEPLLSELVFTTYI